MAPGCQDAFDLIEVMPVGRSDVHDIDRIVGKQFVQVAINLVDSKRPGPFAGPFRTAAKKPRHTHAQPPQRLGMHRADKSGADDRRAVIAGIELRTHLIDRPQSQVG